MSETLHYIEHTIAYRAETGIICEVDKNYRHPWKSYVSERLKALSETPDEGWELCFVAAREVHHWTEPDA
jgi:hypothetical protein